MIAHYCALQNDTLLCQWWEWQPAAWSLTGILFFSLNNWAAPSSEAQVPERPSMWVTSVLSWSEVQRCVWVKGYPGVHFGDVCRVRALDPGKSGTEKACIRTNLTGHNPVSEQERHSGSVWTQPRGSVPWWDVGDISAVPGLYSSGCQPIDSQLQWLGRQGPGVRLWSLSWDSVWLYIYMCVCPEHVIAVK